MPRVKRHKYLLVLVDTFSGWVEAFPTSNKRATTVASIILTHIISRFGMPTSFQSDNGPEFTSQITQTIIKALNIPWQFHIPYHPSSSGKVERSNRTLKEVLTKLTLELHLDWVQFLPIALFCLWVLPRKPTQMS
jgi:transposase InsO family protein